MNQFTQLEQIKLVIVQLLKKFVILFLLAANIASVWSILLSAVIWGCIGVGYIRYEINADHEKNRKFTMEMIIHYLNKDKSTVFDLGNQGANTLDYNTDDSDITKMGFDAENNLSEENVSDEFYSYYVNFLKSLNYTKHQSLVTAKAVTRL